MTFILMFQTGDKLQQQSIQPVFIAVVFIALTQWQYTKKAIGFLLFLKQWKGRLRSHQWKGRLRSRHAMQLMWCFSASHPNDACAESIHLYMQFRNLSNAWTSNTVRIQVLCMSYSSQISMGCKDVDLVPLHLANTHPDNNNIISLNIYTIFLVFAYLVGFLLVIEIQQFLFHSPVSALQSKGLPGKRGSLQKFFALQQAFLTVVVEL